MESLSSKITHFHCLRWNEFPDIDLYMDQVVSILEKSLAIFSEFEGEKIITSTMINNYVKQKLVIPPVKKRYKRTHLAHFFVICIMKKILSISEINELIAYLTKDDSIEQSYDLFCDKLESAIYAVFSTNEIMNTQKAKDNDPLFLLESAALAFANKLFYQVGIKGLQ